VGHSEVEGGLDRLIRDIPDFPQRGILFKDISPLLADPAAFHGVVTALAEPGRGQGSSATVGKVVGIEARGFILAAPVALALGVGFVQVRKAGKLPGATHSVSYALEYGEATLEIHQDAIRPGERVLVVDDVLATGGTGTATRRLVEACGGVVSGCAILLELGSLDGRRALGDLPVHALRTH